jgi:hypothetical protein
MESLDYPTFEQAWNRVLHAAQRHRREQADEAVKEMTDGARRDFEDLPAPIAWLAEDILCELRYDLAIKETESHLCDWVIRGW